MKSKFLESWKRKQEVESAAGGRRSDSSASKDANDRFLGAAQRVIARLSAKALRQNYLAIRELVPGQSLLPMVKADGYGHGAVWVARQCLDLPDLYGLGVATLAEGAELREELGKVGARASIIVFSGGCPWTDEKGAFCEKYHLTPVMASEADFHSFIRGKWAERLPWEIKFNTGMNRLGIPHASLSTVAKALRKLQPEFHPKAVLSHLATGETPEAHSSQQQRERFVAIRSELSSIVPSTHYHLGNSAGIWNQKQFGLQGFTDVVRPGLSLYGIPPWPGAPARGISPVMTLQASVVAVHRLKPGDAMGYGGRYRVTAADSKNGAVHAAVLAAGYADGIHRMLSGSEKSPGGYVWLNDQEQRILGAVSMDLCAVSCSASTQIGDWADLLGPRVDAWAQARAAGTIPYELLTSVGSRVQRIYG